MSAALFVILAAGALCASLALLPRQEILPTVLVDVVRRLLAG